ncbi:expressed unknown protein [Seminavis robusta]|uniref:MBD domain-containing protein n=1 Tax=Seminavis robusta TaxID=568900 RepID=A0A9N8DVM0_9STRA|nr:expressed unknown protein [Seminavis robusta]|eukprot:Sro326_g118230.1 n/a (1701) ;mRNA; r:61971-67559
MERPTKRPALPRAAAADGEGNRRPYGPAQEAFVRETRRAIDANSCPSFLQDWSNIVPWPSSRALRGNTSEDSRRPTSSRILGGFTYYMGASPSYGIRQELYNYISASTLHPLKKIEANLKQFVSEQYNQDLLRYLLDCRDGRVVPKRRPPDPNRPVNPKQQRRREKATELETLKQIRMDLQSARDKAKDISFADVISLKSNHNNRWVAFPLLGISKLTKITSVGIHTGRDLLKSAHDQDERFIKLRGMTVKPTTCLAWVDSVKKEFETLEENVNALAAEVKRVEEQLGEDVALLDDDEDDIMDELDEAMEYEDFGTMENRERYDARFVYMGTIKDVVAEEFNQRRFVMRDRMCQLGGQVLRIHFLYDICKKINAFCKASNKNVIPFKCMAVVLNEKGMVIWWAMVKKERYIDDILGPLKKLKARLDRQKNSVGAIFADESRICRRLKNIFEVVAFDVMEWLEKWNKCLVAPTTNRAETFRALMCKAVMGIDTDDVKRERKRLASEYLRDPTVEEILRACDTNVPEPEVAVRAVMDVLYFFFHEDVQYTLQSAYRPASRLTAKFFKEYDVVVKTVEEQVACVRSASLRLPNHTCNQVKTLCETLDKKVFGDSPFAGIRRAERGIWSVLDSMNSIMSGVTPADATAEAQEDSTAESAQAQEKSAQHTFATSLAASLGMQVPPYQVTETAIVPNKSSETENLGFDVTWDDDRLGILAEAHAHNDFEEYLDTVGREDDLIDAATTAQAGHPKATPAATGQQAVAAENAVITVDGRDNSNEASAAQGDGVNDYILSNENKRKMFSRYERGVAEFVAEMTQKTGKTSLEAFKSLTNAEAWTTFLEAKPFVNDSDDPLHVEEVNFFQQIKVVFCGPMASGDFEQFAKAWNWEAATRIKSVCNGGKAKKPISCKESAQLLEQKRRYEQYAQGMRTFIMNCCHEKAGSKRAFMSYCITCGHSRGHHNFQIESFGPTCRKGFCARCGALQKWHAEGSSEMGFYCVLTAEQSGAKHGKIETFDEYWRASVTVPRPTMSSVVLKSPVPAKKADKEKGSGKGGECQDKAESADESMVRPDEPVEIRGEGEIEAPDKAQEDGKKNPYVPAEAIIARAPAIAPPKEAIEECMREAAANAPNAQQAGANGNRQIATAATPTATAAVNPQTTTTTTAANVHANAVTAATTIVVDPSATAANPSAASAAKPSATTINPQPPAAPTRPNPQPPAVTAFGGGTSYNNNPQYAWYSGVPMGMPNAMMPRLPGNFAAAPGTHGYGAWYPTGTTAAMIAAAQTAQVQGRRSSIGMSAATAAFTAQEPGRRNSDISHKQQTRRDSGITYENTLAGHRRRAVDELVKQRYGGKSPFRKYCLKCAFPKRNHMHEESAGPNCCRNYCARCYARKEYHDQHGSEMGFYCFLTMGQSGAKNDFRMTEFDKEWRGSTEATQTIHRNTQTMPCNSKTPRGNNDASIGKSTSSSSDEDGWEPTDEPFSDTDSSKSSQKKPAAVRTRRAAHQNTGATTDIARLAASICDATTARTRNATVTSPSKATAKAAPATSPTKAAPAVARTATATTTTTPIASNKRKVPPSAVTATSPATRSGARKKRAVATTTTTKSPSASERPGGLAYRETYTGVPNEPLEGGWPPGWTKVVRLRTSGVATNGREDRYWYSPGGRVFRSMVGVRKFLKALPMFAGDEDAAFRAHKTVTLDVDRAVI